MSWQQALEVVLQTIHSPLERDQLRWAVIGSVASTLQGCPFVPRDIDLLTISPEGVRQIAQLMWKLHKIRQRESRINQRK